MNTYMEKIFELAIVFSLGLMIGSMGEIGSSIFWISIILYVVCIIPEELRK